MKIKYYFFVNNYNGGPKIKITNDGEKLYQATLSEQGMKTVELDADLKFPTELAIQHYDKNMKYDTKVQEDEIVDDKGFVLEKIEIDGYVLQNELYHFKFIKDNGEEIVNNNYVGYNGKYIINIDSASLPAWYFKLQKSFINKLETFNYLQFKDEILQGEKSEVIY